MAEHTGNVLARVLRWNAVRGWIMKPHGIVEGVKVPTILEIHGGPHMMYGYTFMHEFQLLAAKVML